MILSVDLGKKTTGLAISHGAIASPFKTITHKNQTEAVEKISQIIKSENIEKVIIGFVEGKIKNLFENFAKSLQRDNQNTHIVMWDESLTSRQARELAITLGKSKLTRKEKEHEIAAALILQSYLDEETEK